MEGSLLRLYQMKAELNGVNMMKVYLEDKYISFGWEGLGNLEQVSQQQLIIQKELELHANVIERSVWSSQWEEIKAFVYEMRDGDYVIIVHEGIAHVGDLGDYYYVKGVEEADIKSCHRRGVTWLTSVLLEQCSPVLQNFLEEGNHISVFTQPVTSEKLEQWISASNQQDKVNIETPFVTGEMIKEAVAILASAMASEDIERRERAAIALLQYAKR